MDAQPGKPQTAVKFVRKNSKHRGSLKTVLIMLADFIDDGNDCPSQNELAEATGLSVSTVRHALGELVKESVITRVKNGGGKVKGGRKDCYAITGFNAPKPDSSSAASISPVTVVVETVVAESVVPVTTVAETTVTAEPAEYAPVHVHEGGDAAGEKDLSLEQEQKTTTTAVVVVPEIESPPNDDELPLVEQAGELGDVARAYDKYCRGVLTSQHSDLFTVMIEDYSAAKVVEAFKAAFGKNDPWGYALWWLKNPQLVDKPKPIAPSPAPVTAQRIADNRQYLEDLARSDSELYLGMRR